MSAQLPSGLSALRITAYSKGLLTTPLGNNLTICYVTVLRFKKLFFSTSLSWHENITSTTRRMDFSKKLKGRWCLLLLWLVCLFFSLIFKEDFLHEWGTEGSECVIWFRCSAVEDSNLRDLRYHLAQQSTEAVFSFPNKCSGNSKV